MSGFQVGFVHSVLPLVVAAANGPIATIVTAIYTTTATIPYIVALQFFHTYGAPSTATPNTHPCLCGGGEALDASSHLSILLNPSILLSRGYLLHLNPQKCPAASESILFK